MKISIIVLLAISGLSGYAQKFEHYEIDNFSLNAGDTIYFGEGSMHGQFRSVFTLWKSNPPVKAPFSGAKSWLVIDHFRRKKKRGTIKFYAVGYLSNIKNVRVFVDIKGAIKNGEIILKENVKEPIKGR